MTRTFHVDGEYVRVPEELVGQIVAEEALAFVDDAMFRTFEELGIDSLERLELVMLLEEYLGVDISDAEVEGRFLEGKLNRIVDLFFLPTVKTVLEELDDD